MSIGEKITMQRKVRGMSQEALANEMDVTRQAVSRWETGDATPDVDKVIQLSKLFGVSTDYLLIDDSADVQVTPGVPAPRAARERGARRTSAHVQDSVRHMRTYDRAGEFSHVAGAGAAVRADDNVVL